MNNEQIAHDLAVAWLYGSKLGTEELIKMYRQYNEEILSALNSEPKEPRKLKPAKISGSPI